MLFLYEMITLFTFQPQHPAQASFFVANLHRNSCMELNVRRGFGQVCHGRLNGRNNVSKSASFMPSISSRCGMENEWFPMATNAFDDENDGVVPAESFNHNGDLDDSGNVKVDSASSFHSVLFQGFGRIISAITFFIGMNVGVTVILSLVFSRLYFAAQKTAAKTSSGDSAEFTNRSNKAGGSRTALLALWGRSQAYRMKLPGASDVLAPELMKQLSLFGANTTTELGLSDTDGGKHQKIDAEFAVGKHLSSLCADLSVFNYHITERVTVAVVNLINAITGKSTIGDWIESGAIFEDQVAFIATLGNTGLVTPMHVRTRWMDDVVDWFVETHIKRDGGNCNFCGWNDIGEATPVANLIILGSGYDTRPYRMKSLQENPIQVYEVDAPGTQIEKKKQVLQILHKSGDSAGTISNIKNMNVKPLSTAQPMPTFVSCDFASQNWMECLSKQGFDISLPSLVVWEGVTMYLSLPEIKFTLKIIANKGQLNETVNCSSPTSTASPPWYIAFDYLNPTWADSLVWRFAMRYAQEPFQSAFTKSGVENLLNSVGLDVLEHLSEGKEMQRRYATLTRGGDDPKIQKPVGIMGSYGGFILAGSRQENESS